MRRGRLFGVLLAGLVITVCAVLFTLPPRPYEVWLNGRWLGQAQDSAGIEAVVSAALEQGRARTVALEADGQRWEFRLADLGLGGPAMPVREAVISSLAAGHGLRWPWRRQEIRLELTPEWNGERLEAALLPVKAALGKEPVPARLEVANRTPVIISEMDGVAVDTQALLTDLKERPEADRYPVPVAPSAPAVTKASLEAMGIRKLIAEWSTSYDPSIPRGENVARAARAFNGLILKPGEILSYNATVGPVDAANGWKEAFVIENGQLVPGVGGGVCQVATTLYGAALRANLEVMERHQHQLAVTYIEPSQDAAIAGGYQDLKLRNATPGHLFIETEAEGGRVTFRLYGDQPEGQEVRIESRVLSSTPFATKMTPDPALSAGQQVIRMYGHPGYASEAYRLVYQGGVLIKKEKLSQDVYLPTTQVVAVGG